MEDILSRINLSTDGVAAVKTTDLVIEAIVEKLEVKQQLFKALDEVAPEYGNVLETLDTIFFKLFEYKVFVFYL